jgi:hypothetical protein
MLWAVSEGTSPGKSELVLLKEGESDPVQNPAAEPSPDANQPAQKARVDELVQNAKVLFEMGKLDEAEAQLRRAITIDTQCQAAYYYLNLIREARTKSAQPPLNGLGGPRLNLFNARTGRQAILAKLNRIRLNQIAFDHLPLAEVVGILNLMVKEQDSSHDYTNLVLYQRDVQNAAARESSGRGDVGSVIITILPALTDVRLVDVLDAIVRVSIPPIKYSVEDYAVVFSAAIDPSKDLYTRAIKVDPKTFIGRLSQSRGKADLKSPQEVLWAIGELFLGKGIDLQPPRVVDFENGMITVRATLQELDTIEQAIAELNTPPAQINTRVKFLRVPEATVTDLCRNLGVVQVDHTNLSKLLSPAQSAVFLKAAGAQPGAKILGSASVTTLSGRQTRVECVDLPTIDTNQEPIKIPLGPAIDMVPSLSNDGWKISLTTTASLTEFLGFDAPSEPQLEDPKGRTQQGGPVPRVRLRQITAHNSVPDGYTLVLANGVDEEAQLDEKLKNDFSDRATLIKALETRGISYEKFREQIKQQLTAASKERFVVLITPTLIDAAGNRLHTDAEIESLTK